MLVNYRLEKDLSAYVIHIAGKDSAGNILANDIELLVQIGDTDESLHAVEALVALLRVVNDVRAIPTSVAFPYPWAPPPKRVITKINGNGNGEVKKLPKKDAFDEFIREHYVEGGIREG